LYTLEWLANPIQRPAKALKLHLPRMRIEEEAIQMDGEAKKAFDTASYLASEGEGRRFVRLRSKQLFFSQGGPADSIFYLQSGRAKLTVVSKKGKEATVTLLSAGDFIGEESLTGTSAIRTATAAALVACVALKIAREQVLLVLHQEHAFSAFFLNFMLLRGMRTQADLIDQLFNSSERRLARTLLLMADFDKAGEPQTMIPPVTQETLADMIGTTRSRVSFFMNRFRKLGYIEYNGRIRVNKSLLNVVLQDHLPGQNASQPQLLDSPERKARIARPANRA
jgi:CRP/FNR family cyclic AMP-dependent transcriptional regulator